MKKIDNPLFESLIKKAKEYNKVEINEAGSGVGATAEAYCNTLIKIGTKLIDGLVLGIKIYPGKIKEEYIKNDFKGKLKGISDIADPKNKPITTLVGDVLKEVKSIKDDFITKTQSDTEFDPKYFKDWIDDFNSGINNYELAINEISKWILDKTSEKDMSSLNDKLFTIKEKLKKYIDDFIGDLDNKLKNEESNESKTNEDPTIIEKLINNNICVDFSTFTKIINEGIFDGKAKRERKKIDERIKNLRGRINSIMTLIRGRANEPERANFKSQKMYSEFNDLDTDIMKIGDEIEGSNNIDINDINKKLDTYAQSLNLKNDEYNKLYKEEDDGIPGYNTVLTTSDHIKNAINNGDANFSQLNSDIRKAVGNSMEAKKAKENKEVSHGEPAKELTDIKLDKEVKRKDVPRGTKDDTVKKFQESIISKYSKDKIISNSKVYKNLKASIDSGQGGYFGPRTEAMIKYLKAGFKLGDTSPDITNELITKINGHSIKESLLFEQEVEFDYTAAEKSLGNNTEKSSTEKKPNSKISKEASAEAIRVSNNKKINSSDVKSQIEKYADKDFDLKREIEKLESFSQSIKINKDYGKGGQLSIANSPGVRFYSNNVALRLFDKKIGKYDIEKERFYENGDDRGDNLNSLVNGEAPRKFKEAASDLWGKDRNLGEKMFGITIERACKKYMSWNDNDIKLLGILYKKDNGRSLDDYLKEKEGTDTNADIDAFRKKFSSSIS